jgi:hypothetical protein
MLFGAQTASFKMIPILLLIRRGAATKTSSIRFQVYAGASLPIDALLTEAAR